VDRSEVREAVVNIYRERRNMARSLKDTETIVQSLEFGIGGVIHFVFAAVYLLIWGVDLLTGFSTFSATVLALTFVFGERNIYESMLFLFVTHPYDVGDCILVGSGTDMFRVKKISLLYTDMLTHAGEQVYMPNKELIGSSITNLTRTRTKREICRHGRARVCAAGIERCLSARRCTDDFVRLIPARNGMLFVLQQKALEHRLQHTTQEVSREALE
ncbi:Mechanosensitive ion channel protein 9, partial [Tetrabaena socialis]